MATDVTTGVIDELRAEGYIRGYAEYKDGSVWFWLYPEACDACGVLDKQAQEILRRLDRNLFRGMDDDPQLFGRRKGKAAKVVVF